MHYAEVEDSLRRSIDSATADATHALVTYAVGRLTRVDGREEIIAAEFTAEAADAFVAACAASTVASTEALTNWLELIDAGDLSDGNMEAYTLWALIALVAQRDFQQNGDPSSVFSLAIALLEVVDFEIDGADIDDFLAAPRMFEQFDTIRSLLATTAV